MNILYCKTQQEYNVSDKNIDIIVSYFAVTKKPNHNIPILRLILNHKSAKVNGYSTFAATYGWQYNNFPHVDSIESIELMCKRVLARKNLQDVPVNFRNHAVDKNLTHEDNVLLSTAFNRNNICLNCPLYQANICMLCGCEIHKKILDRNEVCPDSPSKWGTVIRKEYSSSNISKKDCGCNK
jgi:hypothetical protein